jgi:hypothetical protein
LGGGVTAGQIAAAAARAAEAHAKAAVLAARTAQLAAAAFKAAQAELQVARSWQDKADAAWQAAWDDLCQAKTCRGAAGGRPGGQGRG